jgi:hypothetical protein
MHRAFRLFLSVADRIPAELLFLVLVVDIEGDYYLNADLEIKDIYFYLPQMIHPGNGRPRQVYCRAWRGRNETGIERRQAAYRCAVQVAKSSAEIAGGR